MRSGAIIPRTFLALFSQQRKFSYNDYAIVIQKVDIEKYRRNSIHRARFREYLPKEKMHTCTFSCIKLIE